MAHISYPEEITMSKSSSYQERARLRLSRSPEFYRAFVAGFNRSGISLSEYCAKHQVGESTFRKYLSTISRISKGRAGRSKAGIPNLIPVITAPAETESPFEFILPGGTRIRLTALDESVLALLRPLLIGMP